jgi:hypothetical protein
MMVAKKPLTSSPKARREPDLEIFRKKSVLRRALLGQTRIDQRSVFAPRTDKKVEEMLG